MLKFLFLRPDNISGDEAKSIDFILHAINFYEKLDIQFESILLLQPTSPLRDINLLNDAIKLFEVNNSNSLISCYNEEYINDLVMYKTINSSYLEPLNNKHNKGLRRQDHGNVFVRNGAIYLTKVSYIKETHQIISDKPLLIEMKKSQSINIDTLEDVEILKRIICK